MTDDPISRQTAFPDGPAAVARLLEPALAQAAGPDAEPVSLTLDYGLIVQPGVVVKVEAGVDRATRTLVFVYGRVLNGEGAVVATGAAVFRRVKAR